MESGIDSRRRRRDQLSQTPHARHIFIKVKMMIYNRILWRILESGRSALLAASSQPWTNPLY